MYSLYGCVGACLPRLRSNILALKLIASVTYKINKLISNDGYQSMASEAY